MIISNSSRYEMIIVSHNLSHVKKYADRVILLNKKIISYGIGVALSNPRI